MESLPRKKRMKKITLTVLAFAMALPLAGCSPKPTTTPDVTASPAVTASAEPLAPAEVVDVEENSSTKIVPMASEEGQENAYYQTITDEAGNMFYVVQPDGGGETMKIPVEETVLYGVSSDEEYRIAKIEFSYQNENNEVERVSQYRIYAPMENSIFVNGETPATTPESNP